MALARGQSLAQMALAWVLRNESVTTALCGASRPEQVEDSVKVLGHLDFSSEELARFILPFCSKSEIQDPNQSATLIIPSSLVC